LWEGECTPFSRIFHFYWRICLTGG
jgi:hypothetical protein